MSRSGLLLACALFVLILGPSPRVWAANGDGTALLLHVDGAISPAMADYVVQGLEAAAQQHAEVVILEMDTPGGLDSSMRSIIKAILASPVPVVTYVAPSGSRAASAGTYILYASHIAAMAPATNLGAATPVQLMGGNSPTPAEPKTAEDRKILNDAAAYIHGLAITRGRNAEWANQAVRNAASLTAADALQKHVIDLMATDVPDLLAKLDGRAVTTEAGTLTLHTAGITVQDYQRGFRVTFLEVLTDPTVAYILLLIGIYGLVFEGYNPGGVLPGVAGAIALLLALYAFHVLPVNFAGLALIVLGIILFVTETFVPAYGTLSIGGLVAFVVGSIILMDTGVPGFAISRGLIGGISTAAALIIAGTVWLTVQTHRRPVVSGAEELLNSTGEALTDFSLDGSSTARIHGEIWNVSSKTPIHTGDVVKVIGRDGLKLFVEPVKNPNREDT
ncbi:MAG: nodulation protein NfeD [Gammaproteobacteria bacterium]